MNGWTKDEWDQYYHLLRRMRVHGSKDEEAAAIGLYIHLVAHEQGHYPGLLAFLDFYGEKFLLPEVTGYIQRYCQGYDRIVDLGAGTGWLGRGLTKKLNLKQEPMCVDKRQWNEETLVLDLETDQGVKELWLHLRPSDLIVCCELIHCLEDPRPLFGAIAGWPSVAIEFDIDNPEYGKSYHDQIQVYGATPRSLNTLTELFSLLYGGPKRVYYVAPYMLMTMSA